MVVYLSKNTKDYPPIYVVAQLIFFETGFVRALEILENPGKISPGNPWKSPRMFLLSPGKSHRTLLKK